LQGLALHQLIGFTAALSIIAALSAIAFYAISITGIAYLMMSEIFPLNLRAVGMSVASCANWGFNMLVAASFLTLANAIGMGNTFWLYAGLTFVGFLFVWFFVPETKGRKLEEIEANLYAGVPMRYLGKKPETIFVSKASKH
jgi:MFS transporter, SP family, galactose:H+ symporter